MLGRALFVLALALCASAPADAQTTTSRSEQRARELFEQGRVAYDAGRFDDAVVAFREAYLLSGRPALLYNIGQSELRLERHALALEAFEGYLRQSPDDAALRSEVEERVRVLRGMGVVPATPETRAPSERPASGGFPILDHRLFTWIALGLSAAAAGVAIGVYFDGVGVYDRLLAECGATPSGCTDGQIAASGLPERELATNVLWVTAGAGLLASIVLYVVEGLGAPSGERETEGVRLDVGPGSLVLRGTF